MWVILCFFYLFYTSICIFKIKIINFTGKCPLGQRYKGQSTEKCPSRVQWRTHCESRVGGWNLAIVLTRQSVQKWTDVNTVFRAVKCCWHPHQEIKVSQPSLSLYWQANVQAVLTCSEIWNDARFGNGNARFESNLFYLQRRLSIVQGEKGPSVLHSRRQEAEWNEIENEIPLSEVAQRTVEGDSAQLKLACSNQADRSQVTTFTSTASSASGWFYGTKRGAWRRKCCECQSEPVHNKHTQHSNRVRRQLGNNPSRGQKACRASSWQTVTEHRPTAHMSIHAHRVNPLPSFAVELHNQSSWEALPLLTSIFPHISLQSRSFPSFHAFLGSLFASRVVFVWSKTRVEQASLDRRFDASLSRRTW